jgi:hypothetical protein
MKREAFWILMDIVYANSISMEWVRLIKELSDG